MMSARELTVLPDTRLDVVDLEACDALLFAPRAHRGKIHRMRLIC